MLKYIACRQRSGWEFMKIVAGVKAFEEADRLLAGGAAAPCKETRREAGTRRVSVGSRAIESPEEVTLFMTEKKTLKICLVSANKRCHSNSIISSRLFNYLAANGHSIVENAGEADLLIVNTCGSMEITHKFSKGLFKEALRNRKPGARVVCAGCLGPIAPGLFRAEFGEVTVLKDNSELDALIGASVPYNSIREAFYDESLYPRVGRDPVLFARLLARAAGAFIFAITCSRYCVASLHPGAGEGGGKGHFPQKVAAVRHGGKLHVQIGSGCAGNCSFCVIKLAKGAPASRPAGDIIRDIKKSYREDYAVHLVGDDCGSYGLDTGENLFGLVSAISGEIPGVPLDIRYVNPVWLEKFPAEYLKMFKENRINSVNICMQSGSDRIISFMNRRYRAAAILEFVDELKKVSPRTLIRSHFITGFPTETWGDFRETLRAAGHFHFHNSYVYSAIRGARSYEMRDDVPYAVKALRRSILQARNAWEFFAG